MNSLNKLIGVLLAMMLSISLYSQTEWRFGQGYIIADSMITVINKDIDVKCDSAAIHINMYSFYVDSYSIVGAAYIYELHDGGKAIYTMKSTAGLVLAVYYNNIQIVLWEKPLLTFNIDLRDE
jgi:hypothetical protein